jgi:hypothetical protein
MLSIVLTLANKLLSWAGLLLLLWLTVPALFLMIVGFSIIIDIIIQNYFPGLLKQKNNQAETASESRKIQDIPGVLVATCFLYGFIQYRSVVFILPRSVVKIVRSLFRFPRFAVNNLVINPYTRRVARNPNTVPEKLQKLSKSSDFLTCQALTRHPNTPPEALLSLISDCPYEVIENPMFGLMLLENPRLIAEMDAEILESLFQQEDVPEIFFKGAANHSNYRVIKAIAQHPNVPETVLEQIGMNSWYADIVIRHPRTTPAMLHRLARQGNATMQIEIARYIQATRHRPNLNTPLPNTEEIIATLVDYGTNDVRIAVAKIPGLSVSCIDQLIQKLDYLNSIRLASQKNTRKLILLRLENLELTDPQKTVKLKQAIARHPNTPATILEQFITSRNPMIRAAVAQRQDLSPSYCIRLAMDTSTQVRKKLYRNRSITPNMLTILATDPDLRVREFVSRHPKTPEDLRQQLLKELKDFNRGRSPSSDCSRS